MKHVLLGGVAVMAVLAVAGSAAGAAPLARAVAPPNPIITANNQISLDLAATNFNYVETIPPVYPVFDSEKGWVPGIIVTGSAMGDYVGVHNLYISGGFTWLNGHTNYWSPPGTNIDGAEVWAGDFRLGEGFDMGPTTMVTPYFGAGAHTWSRNLAGPGGYHEDYSNSYAGAGVLLQFASSNQLVLSANALVGSTFNASMTSSLTPGGFPIHPQTYALGSSMIFMAGLSADYAMSQHLHANIGVDYVNFKYGASPVSTIDGTFEPDSTTSNVTVKAGLGYSW